MTYLLCKINIGLTKEEQFYLSTHHIINGGRIFLEDSLFTKGKLYLCQKLDSKSEIYLVIDNELCEHFVFLEKNKKLNFGTANDLLAKNCFEILNNKS